MYNILVFVLLLAGLYIALIYTSPGLVLFVLIGLVAFVLLAAYVLALRFFLLGRLRIPIGVTDPGEQVSVRFLIRNRFFIPLKKIRLCVEVRDSFEDRRRKYWLRVSELERGENVAEFGICFQEPGNYEFYLRAIRFYDPLGLLRGTAGLDSHRNLQVLPRIIPVPVVLSSRVRNFFGDADVYDEEKAGYDNSEIFRIRPYQQGDRPQAIHWKLTAKEGELMVRESSLPKACSVVLFLEENREQWKGGYRFYKFLEAAAAISFSLMDAGCAHYVAWYEERTRDVTRIRVDDEESFYQFLAWYLTEQGKTKPLEVKSLYDDKYRSSIYVSSLRITGDLRLIRDGQSLGQLSPEYYRQQLEELELVF